jgi:ABC-2 type transport system permease protein
VLVNRQVGNSTVQEIQALDYPFFVDILPDGMDTEHPALRSQPTVTLSWTSPVHTSLDENPNLNADVLLVSSKNAWLKPDTNIMPDLDTYPGSGFPGGTDQQQYPLAVAVQGIFESYFKGKPSPLEETSSTESVVPDSGTTSQTPTIEQSTGSARLIVVGGASFVDDFVFQLTSRFNQDRSLNNLQFLQNAVDWSVEDLDLLNIRTRGTSTHLLIPLESDQQSRWEVANYGFALIFLAMIYIYYRQRRLNEAPMELLPPSEKFAGPNRSGPGSKSRSEEEA